MKGAAILAASIAFCDRVVATTTAPTPSPKDDDDYNGSTALFVICSLLLMIGFLVGMYLYSIQPKAPEPNPEETPTPPDLEAELLDLLREYRRIATEIRDVGQAMARRAWADTRQGQFWQEGESHFESHHGEIKEESNEDLTALLEAHPNNARLARLLGAKQPYGWQAEGPDYTKMAQNPSWFEIFNVYEHPRNEHALMICGCARAEHIKCANPTTFCLRTSPACSQKAPRSSDTLMEPNRAAIWRSDA